MGVNHRSLDVLVTEKFLNCPDVVARFQELRGEGMTECVAGGPFGQVGPFHRAVDRLRDDRFVNVMASLLARLWAFSGSPAERSIASTTPRERWGIYGRGRLAGESDPNRRPGRARGLL